MPADEPAIVAVQADTLADQTLSELDALDAALAQVETLPAAPAGGPVQPMPALSEVPEEVDALPLEKRKELARTAASRIADIVDLNEADVAAAQVVPQPVPAAAAVNPDEEIARIKAEISQ